MIWNTLYILHDTDDATIAQAIAQAFGVPAGAVVVEDAPARTSLSGSVILARRDDYRAREPETEFPVELTIVVPSDVRILARSDAERLALIARALRVPFMASLDEDDQDTMRLVLPDGDLLERDLGDVDVILSPSDRERMAVWQRPAGRAA
ncbi:MAG: hypothetical protein QM753_02910 [Thermomicrobiales bacterium]